MSFLIEDILKKDFSSGGKKCFKKYVAEKKEVKYENNYEKELKRSNSCSILQQTLLNKITPYYAHGYDCSSSEKPYSDAVNCDKTYLPHNYLDYYIASGHPYFPLYPRTRCYSTYESLPLVFQMNSKRKGGQVRFTSLQTDALEKRFNSHKYLSPEDRKLLADSLKLTDKQVKTWFQNRRAKWRRSNSISSSTTTGDDYDDNHDSHNDSLLLFCDRQNQKFNK